MRMSSLEKYRWGEIFIMAILILMSGSPILNIPLIFGFSGILALVYSLRRSDYSLRGKLWKYCVFLLLIFLGQLFTLPFISYLGSINVLAKIVFGATIMWVLKDRFREYYLNVMYFFAIVSLVLFFLGIIGISIPDLFPSTINRKSILIYNTLIISEVRNSGPFWEPGAYACYLLLVPLLYVDNLKKFVVDNKKKVYVLFVALITTISTTGYICLFILILYFYLKESKNKFLAYTIYLPLAIGVMYFAYNSLEFMGEKIESQQEVALDLDGEFSNSRMGSLLFDLHYIKKHPLVGNGLHEQTRFADHPFLWGVGMGHGNAFSNYMSQMGVLAMVVYLILLYKAFNRKLIAPIIVVLLFQGEQLLNFPLFLSLPFVIMSVKNNCKTKNILYENNETNSNNYNSIQS